ncbi:hypothetical protein JHK84_043094 [Glycine max]|nr:hypothetical protein JHK84_043094 [Glycine max]
MEEECMKNNGGEGKGVYRGTARRGRSRQWCRGTTGRKGGFPFSEINANNNMNIFKKKTSPKEALRTSKREMAVATRGIEREITSLQMEVHNANNKDLLSDFLSVSYFFLVLHYLVNCRKKNWWQRLKEKQKQEMRIPIRLPLFINMFSFTMSNISLISPLSVFHGTKTSHISQLKKHTFSYQSTQPKQNCSMHDSEASQGVMGLRCNER